jgi:predicted transcriptional regulator
MAKRGKLDIVYDILSTIKDNRNSIKITPLIRKTNLSSGRFKEYYIELVNKNFIKEIINHKSEKLISLTDKGFRFLEKYKTIISFIDEFEL